MQASECKQKDMQLVRELFNTILASQVPIVFHNALVDLVFLYHSFYATLPPLISTFLADLGESRRND